MLRIAPKRLAVYSAVAVLFAVATAGALAGFTRHHSALEYMVAGSLGTTVLLAGAFFYLLRRRRL